MEEMQTSKGHNFVVGLDVAKAKIDVCESVLNFVFEA
mgnify:CR=1 FL=1